MVDRYVTITRTDLHANRAFGINRHKLVQIPDPFDIDAFDEAAKDEMSILLDPHCVYAIQVGALNARKRPDLAVRGFAIARQRCPSLRLILAGDGPDRQRTEQLARDLGVSTDVHICGVVANVPALLTRCHIGLLVSQAEGLALSLIEYMAAGLPVITCSIPAVDELVTHGQNGLVLSDHSPHGVADTLVHLYTSPRLRNTMGQAGRKTVCDARLDPNNIYGQTLNMLLSLVRSRRLIEGVQTSPQSVTQALRPSSGR